MTAATQQHLPDPPDCQVVLPGQEIPLSPWHLRQMSDWYGPDARLFLSGFLPWYGPPKRDVMVVTIVYRAKPQKRGSADGSYVSLPLYFPIDRAQGGSILICGQTVARIERTTPHGAVFHIPHPDVEIADA